MNEQQKIEELLKPRYEVIADWPGRTDFAIGQVVCLDGRFVNGEPMITITDCKGPRDYIGRFFEMFPHLFKPLQWWEKREASEMPEYVWYDPSGIEHKKMIVLKVKRWVKEPDEDIWADVEGDTIGYAADYMPKPATLSDYNNFLNQQKRNDANSCKE